MKIEKSFKSKLFRYQGKGGWIFATVPKEFAPPLKLSWGRTPVTVTLDNKTWNTSVWTDKSGVTLLPVAKKYVLNKDDGDTVEIFLEYRF